MDIGKIKLQVPQTYSGDQETSLADIIIALGILSTELAVTPGFATLTASANLSKGMAANLFSGQLRPADASLARGAIGIVVNAALAGQKARIMLGSGFLSGLNGLTANSWAYLDVAGAITFVRPTSGIVQPLGYAISATELFVLIGSDPAVGGSGGGGGGVTAHALLTGLTGDDHLQYHTDARGDARYAALSHTQAAGTITGLAAVATSGSATDLSAGNLAVARLDSGTGASSTTFWCGNGTWTTPAASGGLGSGVTSVFTRTGNVVAVSGDYTFAQIGSTPTTLAGYGITDAAPIAHVGAGGTAHANVVAAGAAGFMTGTDKTKLDGIATGATANSSDIFLLARANHTGTQTWSTLTATPTTLSGYGITDAAPIAHVGATGAAHGLVIAAGANGFMSGTDKTKLDGIAAGATANSSDIFLLARANHTGTQAWSTITGTPTTLTAYGITDAAPIAHVGSGGTAHAAVVAAGASGFMIGTDKTKLDGIAAGATANSSDAVLLARANHTGTQLWSTLTSTPITLAGYGITDAVISTRALSTTAPLTGGGDLSVNRTLAITSFAGSAPGAVPTSLGGTTNFLRADGSWAAPPSGGGGGGGSFSLTQVTITVPSLAYNEYTANVIDAAVTLTSKIQCSYHYAGDDAENGLDELDSMYVFAKPNAGSIDFTLVHELGAFVGPFVINYAVSA